jgi:hypothetical protein
MAKTPSTAAPAVENSDRAVSWRDCHVVLHPGYGFRLGLVRLPAEPAAELTRTETDADGAPVVIEILRPATQADWAFAQGRFTDLTQKD